MAVIRTGSSGQATIMPSAPAPSTARPPDTTSSVVTAARSCAPRRTRHQPGGGSGNVVDPARPWRRTAPCPRPARPEHTRRDEGSQQATCGLHRIDLPSPARGNIVRLPYSARLRNSSSGRLVKPQKGQHLRNLSSVVFVKGLVLYRHRHQIPAREVLSPARLLPVNLPLEFTHCANVKRWVSRQRTCISAIIEARPLVCLVRPIP